MPDPRDEALRKIGEVLWGWLDNDAREEDMRDTLNAIRGVMEMWETADPNDRPFVSRRRRVVQIAVARSPECIYELYRERLCDDGSVWLYWEDDDKGPRWVRLPDVPQDEEEGE